MPDQYALITGASHGIGLALARECARRGWNILLVALDEPALGEAATTITQTFGVKTATLGIDLTAPGAAPRVLEWVQTNGYTVNCLVNNAGFGRGHYFEQIDWAVYETMMRLNNQVMVQLTYLFLPLLKTAPQAYLLNVSSMEGILPMPVKAVYAATKFFVYGFTLALREEVNRWPIRVSALCPGPVVTNEDGLQRIKNNGASAKLVVFYPEQLAPVALRQLLRGRSIIIPGIVNRILVGLYQLLPRNISSLMLRGISRNSLPPGVKPHH